VKLPLLLTLLVVVATGSAYADDGPFGLRWGATEKDLVEQGVIFKKESDEGGFETFITTSLPKNLSIADMYVLLVHKKYELQKVVMFSKEIEGDIYGTKGKEIYQDLKSKLVNKYGAPNSDFEKVGVELFTETNEFYQCLAYDGCGYWSAMFSDKDKGILVSLQLKGIGRGKGFVKLAYEGPDWEEAMEESNSELSKSDAGVL